MISSGWKVSLFVFDVFDEVNNVECGWRDVRRCPKFG